MFGTLLLLLPVALAEPADHPVDRTLGAAVGWVGYEQATRALAWRYDFQSSRRWLYLRYTWTVLPQPSGDFLFYVDQATDESGPGGSLDRRPSWTRWEHGLIVAGCPLPWIRVGARLDHALTIHGAGGSDLAELGYYLSWTTETYAGLHASVDWPDLGPEWRAGATLEATLPLGMGGEALYDSDDTLVSGVPDRRLLSRRASLYASAAWRPRHVAYQAEAGITRQSATLYQMDIDIDKSYSSAMFLPYLWIGASLEL